MSARKRHTAALDFMRMFMVGERNGDWRDLYGPGWKPMIKALIKRGWIEQYRDQGTKTGTFRPVLQRRNYLRSTAIGRRAVYRVDRHAEPHLRPHAWGIAGGYRRRMFWARFGDQQRLEKLATLSVKARDLHGARR